MCGVFGWFHRSGVSTPGNLEEALSSLKRRGPDAQGTYEDEQSAVWHFRLRIQDPVSGSDQPMVTTDQNYVISFNGQIFNHGVLRQELKTSRGIKFRTDSDTEVLLQSYISWGVEGFSRLEGDFAGFIYDKVRDQVIAFRDSSGVKPLYLYKSESQIVLSSLIEPIKVFLEKKEVNIQALAEHATFRHSFGNKTLMEGVERIPIGGVYIFDLKKFDAPVVHQISTLPSGMDDLGALISESVRMRLPMDHDPVLFLSGGIDSLGIAGLFKIHADKWSAVTLKTGEAPLDVATATQWATENHVDLVLTTPPKDRLLERLKDLISRMEEPVGDSVCLLQDQLFNEASQRTKVAFSGEGADEMFCGYAHHLALWTWGKWGALFGPLIRFIPYNIFVKLNPYPEKMDRDTFRELKRTLETHRIGEVAFFLTSFLREAELVALFSEAHINKLREPFKKISSFADYWEHEHRHWLPNFSLVRIDKLSMSRGLEVRVPFISDSIRRNSRESLDQQFGLRQQKNVLRKALRKVLAPRFLKRKKHPLTLLSQHSVTKELVQIAESILNEPQSLERTCWQLGGLKKVLQMPKTMSYTKKIINLLMLELWMRINIDEETIK